jgi:hypothetical protein
MFRSVTFLPLVSVLMPLALAGEPKQRERPAADLLSAGVAQAKEQGKRVFLLFGSPG